MSDKSADFKMDHKQVAHMLPHRPPLLLVDRVMSMDFQSMRILAIKCVSGLDPVFEGHFPGDPVVPGVYIVEGMAQASALLCFRYFEHIETAFDKKCLLTGIEEARFRRPVVPGDVMEYDVTLNRCRGTFAWFTGQVRVDGEIVAEAKFSALLPTPLQLQSRGN
jgi:3-hydroxyacyl-[acyl-carrier-protein] dehydratase